jgi:transposase
LARKYPVVLSAEQRQELQAVVSAGKWPARTQTHAHILLKADEGAHGPNWTNAAIATAFETSAVTIWRVCKRFGEAGLEAALQRKPQVSQKVPKLDGAQEAHLIALACSAPPDGRSRWTLRLLAHRFVELGHVEDLSHETVRQVLKGGLSSPGSDSAGASLRKPTANL